MRTKLLLICGILSSVLYMAMNVFIAGQWEDYSSRTMTVSELSAVGAPTRALWVPWGFVYTLLTAAFGWGVRVAVPGNRRLRIAGGFLVAYGITGLAWPLFPMHLREVLAAGGGTWSDTMHIIFTSFTVLLMMLAMGFGAAALGKAFRIYTILTMVLLATFGALTSEEAPALDVNGPTPWIGVFERVNIGVFLLWVIVLAVVLLPRSSRAGDQDKLIAIKLFHTAVWVFMNVVIFYVLYAVLVDRIDLWMWIGLAVIGVECLVLVLFKMACPLTLVARRYSSSQLPNFDIYLPLWLAKYNKHIYGIILVGILAGLAWRLS
ncbi:MAG: DUF998 domain-containing protein [Flavobacteriales bacterium]|nr:DUF998 domain-containing protein [Flavobacteriales bacterium]